MPIARERDVSLHRQMHFKLIKLKTKKKKKDAVCPYLRSLNLWLRLNIRKKVMTLNIIHIQK